MYFTRVPWTVSNRVFSVKTFSASDAPSLISCIYGSAVTSQNGGDKAQNIAMRGPGSENVTFSFDLSNKRC